MFNAQTSVIWSVRNNKKENLKRGENKYIIKNEIPDPRLLNHVSASEKLLFISVHICVQNLGFADLPQMKMLEISKLIL